MSGICPPSTARARLLVGTIVPAAQFITQIQITAMTLRAGIHAANCSAGEKGAKHVGMVQAGIEVASSVGKAGKQRGSRRGEVRAKRQSADRKDGGESQLGSLIRSIEALAPVGPRHPRNG